jgi:hypothetical protein
MDANQRLIDHPALIGADQLVQRFCVFSLLLDNRYENPDS